jgi:hypothetical protein
MPQKTINISDSRNRDAQVVMQTGRTVSKVQRVDGRGQRVDRVRVVKGSLETDLTTLTADCSREDFSQRLVDGDPEIDIELFGRRIGGTTQIYLCEESNAPAYGVRVREFVHDPSGELKEERDLRLTEANINLEKPLRWSGRLLPKEKFYNKFAFTQTMQISHINGLTYDFLYEMAKELEEKAAFLFLGAGDKGDQPLILTRNGSAARGFLEGRPQGDEYLLLLHLTNLELKSVVTDDAAS